MVELLGHEDYRATGRLIRALCRGQTQRTIFGVYVWIHDFESVDRRLRKEVADDPRGEVGVMDYYLFDQVL